LLPAWRWSTGPDGRRNDFDRGCRGRGIDHRWVGVLGDGRVDALEDDLEAIVGTAGTTGLVDLPGWLR
jgi:hypothetical protein